MKTKTLYLSFDDQEFDSSEACRAYESAHVETRLVGLTPEQIRSAVTREDTDLADAIEEIGKRITKARLDAGELRRGKKAPAEQDATKQAELAAVGDGASKLDEALKRAHAAGRAAWDRREGAIVPEAFATAKPLHDAWLDGWEQGQAEAARLREATAEQAA